MEITPVNVALDASQARPSVPVVKEQSAGVKFESMVLQTVLEDIMPDQSSVYGAGMSGSFWKSQMAQVVAEQLALSGSFGIAKYVDDKA
ncbi:MAG: hypothetical protein OXR62_02315 [Ahrensia sp.]|nr:hypothetical protein [Ahrensia sp.]